MQKATVTAAAAAPAIGAPWPGIAGSSYAGIARGENGQPDGHLVLLPDTLDKGLSWKDAVAWAEALGNGARLPTRFESALIYANLQDKVDTSRWHWTGTQYSGLYAWNQFFDDGYQLNLGKKAELRARAVRRFPLQSFNPSEAELPSDSKALLQAILKELQGARADVREIFLADTGATS